MAAITVGSVEVDVVPNTRGIHRKLTDALVPAATAAGEAAGNAAGDAFGPAMTSSISDSIGARIGTQIGTQIANRITATVRGALRDGITQGGPAARPAATRQGEQTGSAFARSLKARLEAAMRDLPEIRLNANSTDAEREIYQIRAQLHALQSVRIGIDISSADAVATIARIQERLRQLSTSDADVAIRVDAAGAATQLAAIQAQVNRLDGQTARVDVDASTAAANLHLLATAALAFGPAIIPALPIVAAGLGAVAAAATAAGVGIGSVALVALPAFKQIGGVLQAQKAAQTAATSATNSGAQASSQAAEAQAKYRAELAKLTPAARETFNAFLDLRSAFGAWSKSLQPQVMPIFTRAINGLKNSLPGLTPFVKEAAAAISNLQDRASRGFKSPWWKEFKTDLQGSIKPAIEGLGVSFGRIFKGIVGVIDAFLPHMDGISSRMQTITGRFAKWGQGLKGSPEFEKFLKFASEKGPQMGSALKKVAEAFLDIGKALSPVSGPVLKFIGILADGISTVAEHAPWLVIALWGIILAWRLWTIAVWAWNAAMAANPLVLIIGGLFLLAAAVVYCYNKFGWFRDFVDGLWSAIKAGAQGTIDWFRGPFVRFFTEVIPGWFRGLLNWVKQNWPWILIGLTGPIGIAVVQIHKHWDKIKEGIATAWGAIKRTVLYPIRDFFTKTIPGWGKTLKEKMVGAFDAARAGIKTAWDKVKKIARDPVQYVVDFVYNNGIRRVWNLVTDAFGGKHLDPIKFATGGIMPGYTPGRDVHMVPSTSGPVALSGGEAIMRPEWTRAVGPGYVNAMNSAARSGGVGGVQSMLGFKDGGIFSGIGDIASGAWDKVKKGASWLKDSFGSAVQAGVKSVVNPLINAIPGDGGFPKILKDSMKNLALKLVGAGKKGDEKSTGPGVLYKPGKGVEQWRPVVNRALAEVHQPKSLANTTLRRMNQESGGNPTIVNKWDSNWKAGHPSVGLMQVIGPTFRSHAGKYRKTGPFLYGTSVNPMANIYSSMKYAMSAYGNLSRAYNRAGGYDSGGYLQPGLNLAYNGTGRPEPVFTTTQANALTNLAASGGGAGPASFTGDLYLDSGEFLGKVRGQAEQVMHKGLRELTTVIRSN